MVINDHVRTQKMNALKRLLDKHAISTNQFNRILDGNHVAGLKTRVENEIRELYSIISKVNK